MRLPRNNAFPVPFLAVVLTTVLATTPRVDGALMTNGSLTVDIRNDNGAIDTVLFGGTDFFNPGSPVSDFGFQNASNTGTFRLNTTTGGTGQPVTVSGSNVVSGTYTAGGANVDFSRSYLLVPGQDVLRITTVFTNNGSGLTLSYFDTFDPDQGTNLGLGPGTFNDVFSLAGATVGQASINGSGFQHTVIAGSADPNVTVAAGSPFAISSGSVLNGFFAAPFDGNGAFADQGLHIGIRSVLAAGGSLTFSYDLAFGLTPAAAQAAFSAAQASSVPEPASLAVWGLGAVCMAAGAARRRTRQAA